MDDLLTMIYEGMYDPCTNKAIFVVGGPGSGKTWVIKRLGLQNMGFVLIDSDYPLERYMKAEGLDLKMPEHESDKRLDARQRAKNVTKSKKKTVLREGLGIVIAETGSKIESTISNNQKLKNIGYDTSMIFVNADLETAIHRNQKRSRSVPNKIVEIKWHEAQKNLGKFQYYFDNFYIIDNSQTSNVDMQLMNLFKKIKNWCKI
jgi:shikimate kinase